MIFREDSAIEYLGSLAKDADAGESAHWRKCHSEFRFTGDGFVGLQGFGGSDAPYKGLRRVLHRIIQKRYRNMGEAFPDFQFIDGAAHSVLRSQKRAYDLDVLRQTITTAYLRHKLGTVVGPDATACVIGDGFGSLTRILLEAWLASTVVLVNLNRTLLVDLWYLRKWIRNCHKNISVCLPTDESDFSQITNEESTDESQRIIAVQAVNYRLLRNMPLDVAINIASMQEMNPEIIGGYFEEMRIVAGRKLFYFYCCNREEKVLPDGTVIRFSEYPWDESDEILEDRLCPWHQYYYSLKPPFYRPYKGPMRHRLVRLAGDVSVPVLVGKH